MTRIDTDIDNDDQEPSDDFDLEVEAKEVLPESEKNHQQRQLMQKRRAIEERLAQMALERETRDFDFDNLDD